MSYSLGYIPGDDFGRTCDVCGRLRPGKSFRHTEGLWICDRHPSYIPRQTLDRERYLELGAPLTIMGAKPFSPIDTYEVSEAQILDFVTADAPGTTERIVTNGAGVPVADPTTRWAAAGWTCLYLYDLIAENKRPARWISLARAALGARAEFLYSGMKGGPGVVGFTDQDVEWGAFDRAVGRYLPADTAACGLALLRAYQVFGTAKYLAGARACAWFLRTCQCGDKLVAGFFSSDAGGTSPKHFGGFTSQILAPATFAAQFKMSDLACVEFLHAFKGVAGDETIGSPAITATFASSRAAPVSTVISEAIAFYTTPQWSVDDGAAIVGLSTVTPRDFFSPYPVGRGSWQFADAPYPTGTAITAQSFTLAMRGLRAVNGDAAVAGLFDWLMTFASNPTFEQATTSHTYGQVTRVVDNERAKYAGFAGTYDPKLALAQSLQVRTSGAAGTTLLQNLTSFYDLGDTAHLAPLYSARQKAGFTALKDALVVPRPRWRQGFEPRDGQYLYLGPLATCGLALQPFTDNNFRRTQSVARAAMLGAVYRYAPQAYTLKGAGA